MTVRAVAETEINAPLSHVFAHFVDFPNWNRWMPEIFAPASGPQRALRGGDHFKVRIGKLPLSLEVVDFKQDAEFGWRGGSTWAIQGVHRFRFESVGGKTRITSEETLSGLLVFGFMAPRVARDAKAQAIILMERFASYLSRFAPSEVHAN